MDTHASGRFVYHVIKREGGETSHLPAHMARHARNPLSIPTQQIGTTGAVMRENTGGRYERT